MEKMANIVLATVYDAFERMDFDKDHFEFATSGKLLASVIDLESG